ncbi:MAG: ABC transporter substrate-binding protein [Candidatus Bipolaricaulota bacterium]
MIKSAGRVLAVITLVLLVNISFGLGRESHPPEEPLVVPINEANSLWEMQPLSSGEPGGQINYTLERFPRTFNHLMATSDSSADFTSTIMGSGLTATNPVNGRVVPGFARSWEVSEDGLTYTFHLRKGLKFSDGEPLTAEDVLFTYEELAFNDRIDTGFTSVVTVDGQLPEVEMVDEHTVRFHLPAPYGPFLRLVSTGIYPSHKFEDFDPDNFEDAWDPEVAEKNPEAIVGAGPFKLAEFVPGEKIVMERNPYYYKVDTEGTQLPYVDGFTALKVKDDKVALLKFVDRKTDFLKPQINEMPFLLQQIDDDWNVITGEGTRGAPVNSDFLTLNWETEDRDLGKLFAQDEFRRAVSLAIDRERIIDRALNSFGGVQLSPIPAVSAYYNPEVEDFFSGSFDPKSAAGLLEDIGLTDSDGDGFREYSTGRGVEFTVVTNEENEVRKTMGEVIVDGLQGVGINASLEPVSFSSLVRKLQSGDYQGALISVMINPREPSALADVFASSGSLHFWSSRGSSAGVPDWQKEIDESFAEGVKHVGFAERKEYYDRFQLLFARHLPVIYLAGETFLYVTQDSVQNTKLFSKLGTFPEFCEYVWTEG